MLNKVVVLFLIFLSFFSLSFAQECSFTSGDCVRISEPFIEFDLTVDERFERVDARLYEENIEGNFIKLEIDDTKIRNINPLLKTGVYVLDMNIYNKGGLVNNIEKRFVFENSDLVPPFIPLEITSSTFSGKTYSSNQRVVAWDINGNIIGDVTSNQSNEFIMNLNLNNGINYVRFFTENGGVQSPFVERIVTEGKVDFVNQVASIISINPIDVITRKRNYYVSGSFSGSDGSEIYVNGERAIAKDGGFGAFVLLNEGLNEIEVKSGSLSDTKTIEYLNPRFQFLKFEFPKFMRSSSQQFSVDTNTGDFFKVYLNGKYLFDTNSDFDLSQNEGFLKEGKNYIFLEGKNNQRISQIFYNDLSEPQIEVLTNEKLVVPSEFVFKITDDIGIDVNSIQGEVGGFSFTSNDLDFRGDFFILELENLSLGVNTYNIEVFDLSGKRSVVSGEIDVSEENILIERVFVKNGEAIGNHLFLRERNTKVSFKPSKNIAFKSVKVDGDDFSGYEIYPDNSVEMDFDFTEDNGVIELVFLNQAGGEEFTEEFFYFTDMEKPVLNLDYVENPSGSDLSVVRVSGEIKDSFFDWSSFLINGEDNFNVFGKYFEGYVDLREEESLEFSGVDISGNSLEGFLRYNGFFYYDDSYERVDKSQDDDFFEDSYAYVFSSSQDEARNHIDSYDGFYSEGMYIYDTSFNLPVQQRYGYRNLNLKGHEDSGLEFEKNDNILVEMDNFTFSSNTESEIYLTGNDRFVSDSSLYLQGNIIAEEKVDSVSVGGGNCEFNDYSFVCFVRGLAVGDNDLRVVADISGSQVDDIITVTKVDGNLVSVNFNNSEKFSGDRLILYEGDYLFSLDEINANFIKSDDERVSLIIDGEEVLFGEVQNTINIDLTEQVAHKNEDEFEVQIKVEDEFGNYDLSEKVTLIYNRVLETLVKVFVS